MTRKEGKKKKRVICVGEKFKSELSVGYEWGASLPGLKKTCLVIAQLPATPAQIAELMAICLVPRVLLNMAPLIAPATMLLLVSCLPR